jgi:hypothetical protein
MSSRTFSIDRKRVVLLSLLVWFLLSLLAARVSQAQDDSFPVSNVQGDANFRAAGEYFWRHPAEGQSLDVGDRVRVRNGAINVKFPQGLLRMEGPGEMEIRAELIDGIPEPWRNEIDLFVGLYTIHVQGDRLLRAKAIFTDIESCDATVIVRQTPKATEIEVFSGSVVIRHTRMEQQPITVKAGQAARADSKGIRFIEPSSTLVASNNY